MTHKKVIRTLLCMLIAGSMVQFVPSAMAQQGSRFTPRDDVTVGAIVTQIQGANSARVALVCTNNDAVNAIRIGDASVSATKGQRVPPGGTFSVTATPAVFGFSEGGTVTISCSEEIR